MDTAPHTVTVTSGPVKFDSGTLQKGESFSYTFKETGTYEYYCAVHPDMTASVKVVGGSHGADPGPDPGADARSRSRHRTRTRSGRCPAMTRSRRPTTPVSV